MENNSDLVGIKRKRNSTIDQIEIPGYHLKLFKRRIVKDGNHNSSNNTSNLAEVVEEWVSWNPGDPIRGRVPESRLERYIRMGHTGFCK